MWFTQGCIASERRIWVSSQYDSGVYHHVLHCPLAIRFCTPKQLSLLAITHYEILGRQPVLTILLRIPVLGCWCYLSSVLPTTSYKPEHHRDQNFGLLQPLPDPAQARTVPKKIWPLVWGQRATDLSLLWVLPQGFNVSYLKKESLRLSLCYKYGGYLYISVLTVTGDSVVTGIIALECVCLYMWMVPRLSQYMVPTTVRSPWFFFWRGGLWSSL